MTPERETLIANIPNFDHLSDDFRRERARVNNLEFAELMERTRDIHEAESASSDESWYYPRDVEQEREAA